MLRTFWDKAHVVFVNQARRHIWRSLLHPVVLILVLSALLKVLNLYVAQRIYPYTSDDVSWQTILFTWRPFSGHMGYIGLNDVFVANAPLLGLFDHMFFPTRTLLFVESSIYGVFNFGMFVVAGLYFLKKCSVKVTPTSILPFLWIGSFGYAFSVLLLNTDWRDFESGVSFLYFMLAAKVYFGEIDPLKSKLSKCMTVVVSAAAGIFIYSDPYFFYFTVFPILVFFIVLFLLKRVPFNRFLTVLTGTMGSLVLARYMQSVMARAGLYAPGGRSLGVVTLDAIPSNVVSGVKGLLEIFGANFFGMSVRSLATVTAFANFLLLGFVAYKMYAHVTGEETAKHKVTQPLLLISGFFGLLSAFVFLVFVFSTAAVDSYDYRYFILVVYVAVLLLSVYLGTVQMGRKVLVSLILLSITLNVVNLLNAARAPVRVGVVNAANAYNYETIHAVESLGLTKGYGSYWDGNINTYLSGGTVTFLPITCVNGHPQQLRLLVDASLFSQPAKRSFYLVDADVGSPYCSEAQIITAYGQPTQTLQVADNTIMVYNFDLKPSVD